jgi:dienelactone hydrolase
LLTALNQLAQTTGHAELASSKLILLSFSGGGSLVARMAGYAPDRVAAVIPYAPGHFEPLGINTVELPEEALQIPQLIIANGGDKVCGTDRPYRYFRKYRDRGAPWVFVIQNDIPHCCVDNAKRLILSWLDAVLKLKRLPASGNSPREFTRRNGWRVFFKAEETNVKDEWRQKTWNMRNARIQPAKQASPPDLLPAGWLPAKSVAEAWLEFANKPHSVISQP